MQMKHRNNDIAGEQYDKFFCANPLKMGYFSELQYAWTMIERKLSITCDTFIKNHSDSLDIY